MSTDTVTTLVSFFKALADASRLRILGLVAHEERSVDELAALLDLKAPTVSHHLKRLSALSLVSKRTDGNSHLYRLNEDALHLLNKEVLRTELVNQATADAPADRFDHKVLSSFIVDGKLTVIPAQRKKRDVILRYLVERFEHEREYTEVEVNAIIKQLHPDAATLRRELVGASLMTRAASVYRRVASSAAASTDSAC